jgi:hypothetical protein
MLIAQKSLKQKKSLKKLYSWRGLFSIFFTSGLSPYNDAFLTYSVKRKKNPKCRSYETWAVEILPP